MMCMTSRVNLGDERSLAHETVKGQSNPLRNANPIPEAIAMERHIRRAELRRIGHGPRRGDLRGEITWIISSEYDTDTSLSFLRRKFKRLRYLNVYCTPCAVQPHFEQMFLVRFHVNVLQPLYLDKFVACLHLARLLCNAVWQDLRYKDTAGLIAVQDQAQSSGFSDAQWQRRTHQYM
jgi:hypothetical protein